MSDRNWDILKAIATANNEGDQDKVYDLIIENGDLIKKDSRLISASAHSITIIKVEVEKQGEKARKVLDILDCEESKKNCEDFRAALRIGLLDIEVSKIEDRS